MKLAWRDSRGSRSRLLIALGVIAVSTAAVIAIMGFGATVRLAVHQQAKSLLGADLVFSSRQSFTPETETLIATLGGAQSREISCTSMVYFPKSAKTRLAQIRATEGGFPYYGRFETEPPTAAQNLQTGPYAIVEDSLLLQFNAQVGDTITIGAFPFQIIGRLKKIPGEAAAVTLLGPRVYIPLTYLAQTALVQKESQVAYKVAFKFAPDVDPGQMLQAIEADLREHHVQADTVEKHAASLGRVMENLTRFLNLIGFVALLLGGIGITSAVQVHIEEKRATVAVLRCIGARMPQVFAVYILQALVLGVLGGFVGMGLGIAMQAVLPWALRDFLPVTVSFALSWRAILQGLSLSIGIVLLWTLLPLSSIRSMSPLLTLRVAEEGVSSGWRDPFRWIVAILIALSIAGFAYIHTTRWTYSLVFCVVLGAAVGLLAAVAHLLMVLTRRSRPRLWPYVWRQGLANLSRPQNQTGIVILVLGVSTFLLATVYTTQHMLLQQVSLAGEGNQPNLVLFDIQSDQREDVTTLLRSFTLPVLQHAPIVTMRLAQVKERKVEDILAESDEERLDWVFQREYHATYRDHLTDTETVLAGEWRSHANVTNGVIPLSVEKDIAEALGVTLGDTLVFDVQGVRVSTTVGSIRRVDWQRVKPNFFVVFPTGVLEAAPQTYIFVTRIASPDQSAAVQRAVVQRFPNVSAIDLTLILHTVDGMLKKIAFGLRFMALFSLVAGVSVLIGTVITSRAQRVRENILLRTLGASRAQIRQILFMEYAFLGSFAAVAGLALAVIASWVLAFFFFEVRFVAPLFPLGFGFLLVLCLTVGVGLLGNRGVANVPPLAVLREEG